MNEPTRELRPEDIKPTIRDWLGYALGNLLGLVLLSLLFFVATRMVILIFWYLQRALGPLPDPFIGRAFDYFDAYALPIALAFALALLFIHNYVNWESLRPHNRAMSRYLEANPNPRIRL